MNIVSKVINRLELEKCKIEQYRVGKNSMQHWKRHTKSWKCSLTIRKHLVIEIIRK